MSERILDKNGKVIQTSHNLAGIRKYVSNHLIKWLDICPIGENGSEGQLSILFDDGASFQTNFADFGVLKNFVRNWRNVYGAVLTIGGIDCGTIEYDNLDLAENKLPSIKDIRALLIELKSQIGDEYRASDDSEDTLSGMSVTIGWNDKTGDWSYQTGDNSYIGGAYSYPIWAVISLYRKSNSTDLAKDILNQLADQSA